MTGPTLRRFVQFLVGAAGFGVLMALRESASGEWTRAGFAGVAAAWLCGLVRLPARRSSRT